MHTVRTERRATVLGLDDPAATDVDLVGGKAAALADAMDDLPVLPGFVITVAATGDRDHLEEEVLDQVRERWDQLSDHGRAPVVARSSSPSEDSAETSMAGRFESVLDLDGWDDVGEAIELVLRSRRHVESQDDTPSDLDIAVLVQLALTAPRLGGVMFTRDPVHGQHVVVSAVPGSPEPLVSGQVDGATYRLDDEGEVVEHEPADDGVELDADLRRQLVRLAADLEAHYGAPQDVEWAVDRDGVLWLLQSRPITTAVPQGEVTGPVFGPGPVTETFPEPLTRLEQELWLPPLGDAIRSAVSMAGIQPTGSVEDAVAVIAVGGRVAVNLDLFDDAPGEPSLWQRIDPRPRVRKLVAAWQVGRLRSLLPDLGHQVLARIDAELAAVPDLTTLTDRQLVGLFDRGGAALRSLHGHEIAIGLLVDVEAPHVTGNSLALRLLASTRAEGWSDEEIMQRYPTVLTLSAPRICARPELPASFPVPPTVPPATNDLAALREALRLRVRWTHELQARAAWHLGARLTERGVLSDPEAICHLSVVGIAALVQGQADALATDPPAGLDDGPLPAAFRLAGNGVPVPVGGAEGDGQGAGGGSGTGPVHLGTDTEPADGDVLVVSSLKPAIAPWLPRLAGLAAETGSPLSHIAILAREAGVPTVVKTAGATTRFSPGQTVVVDGTTGSIEPVTEQTQG